MGRGWKVMRFGAVLTAAFALGACGGDGDSDSDTSSPQGGAGGTAAGSGNAGTAGTGALGGGGAGGSTGGAGSGGGSAGSASGGTGGSVGGSFGTGGADGGSAGTSGSGGGGAEECIPASTEGLTYSGTCLYPDHCSDQYDTTFGPALLEQACVSQSGTWSSTPCNPADWQLLCTQEVLGGVYLQYLLADGNCILGCEEVL